MKIFGFTFGEKKDDEISNIEISEDIVIDTTPETKNIEDNSENENSFFASIYNSTSNWTTNIGENIADTFNSAKKKTGEAYNYISETGSSISSSTKENFVSIKDKIGNSYEQIEIKNNLYLLLDLISIPILIVGLKKLSLAVPDPQVKIGIVLLVGLLVIFEEHKNNTKNSELTKDEINEKTNFEVSKLLKNVDLNSIITTLQPFEKQIPYGKQFFFIVKLFAK